MVLFRLTLGFASGLIIPFMVNDTIYMTIASSFLRPHLKYRIEREQMDKNKAVST